MFRNVPECSGMFRNVPCSWFYRRPSSSAANHSKIQSGTRQNASGNFRGGLNDYTAQIFIYKVTPNRHEFCSGKRNDHFLYFPLNITDRFLCKLFYSFRKVCLVTLQTFM